MMGNNYPPSTMNPWHAFTATTTQWRTTARIPWKSDRTLHRPDLTSNAREQWSFLNKEPHHVFTVNTGGLNTGSLSLSAWTWGKHLMMETTETSHCLEKDTVNWNWERNHHPHNVGTHSTQMNRGEKQPRFNDEVTKHLTVRKREKGNNLLRESDYLTD